MAKKGYVYIATTLNNSVLNTGGTNRLGNQLILRTPVKYTPSLMKCFRASNFTPTQSFFLVGQAGQASHFTPMK